MRAPSARRASTRSPIGRSCIRGAPESRYSPPASARTAVSGRKAVPALPRRRSADLFGNGPPRTVAESRSMRTPRSPRAFSITPVSSESSRFSTRVSPSASAASSSTRLEMLFDPGIFTVPCTRAIGPRSRNFTARSFPVPIVVLQPALARAARPREERLERPGVAAFEHLAHALELPAVAPELDEQGLAVRQADVAPHLRVAPGDAGEIAESSRREGKELLRVRVARDLIDERVGDDGLLTEERRDGAHHRLHLPDRHREQREIGVPERGLVERTGRVDYFQFERAPDVPPAAPDAERAADRARLFQRERERAADQADAHDHQLPDARHQPSSAVRSALRNFSFSLGVPTVTRRWSGMS